MAFENGEIRSINVQGTVNTIGGVTIFAPQKGNRGIITQVNINYPVDCTVSLYRHSAFTGKKILLYKISLTAGDIIDDGVGYNLGEGDSLYLVADEGAANWSVEGFEYEKNCLNIPTAGRGQLRVIDSNGNFKGIGAQGPPGPPGEASVTSAEFASLEGRVDVNSAQMISSDAALSLRIDAVSVGSASVTSAEYLSLVNRVSGNSAQMVSADNAISNAVSVLSSIVSGVVSNAAAISLAVSVLSTSLSAETVNRVSADNALSNAVSVVSAAAATKNTKITIQNQGSTAITDPATINFNGNAVSTIISAGVTKINISAAGAGSVTSANFASLRSVVQANSAQMTSADNAISNAVSIVSAAQAATSAQVATNSAQMTSADNAISNAVSIVSVAQAETSAAVTSVNQIVSALSANVAGISLNISALSTRLSALSTTVATNSAQMTSADNAISNAVSIVSVAVVQEASVRSVQAISIMSAVAVNSAQMTSADNAISNAVSIVSAAQAATSAAVTSVNNAISVISQQVSALSARVASNSADFTSFKASINNFGDVSISSPASAQVLRYVSATGQWVNQTITGGSGSVTSANFVSLRSVVQANSAQMTSADNAISNAVSIVSAAQADTSAAVTSVNQIVSVISQQVSVLSARVAANSAQMVSADNAISNAVSIVSVAQAATSAAQAATSAAVTSVNQVVSVLSQQVSVLSARVGSNSADFTSFKQSINNFGDVSTSSPASAQVLRYVSATGQWTNQTITGGSGSVTSANFVSLRSVVQANSAQMVSADNAISNAVSVVSAAVASVQSAVSALQFPAIESVTSAVYSVVEADRGKIKYFTNATSIEVILGNGLTSGFQAVIWRGSAAGELKLSAVTTLESQGTVLSAINTAATIIHKGSNVWMAAGAFAGGGGAGSVTSAELSAVSAAAQAANSALSAQMASAILNEASVRSAADAALSVRIDSAGGGPFLNTQIRIVSSMQSTNGSALVAVSGLVLSVNANETWKIEGYLLISTSAATAGLRAGFSVPPLSLPRYAKFIAGSAAQSATIAGGAGQLPVSGQSITLSITGIGPAGAAVPVKFDAFFNVASAGTVNLMACGIASTAASPLHIMAGSYMICYRVK